MANEPRINLALVGEMPANPVKGTVYMSPDTSGNFIKVGVDGAVRTIFDGSNYVLKEESPWAPGEGEGSAVLKVSGSIARGSFAVAEGYDTIASGNYSHAEGIDTIAYGSYSHAEGKNTTAVGSNSHAEGKGEYYLMDSSISGEAGSTSYTLSKSVSFRQNQIIYYANTNTYAKIISTTNTTLNLDKTLDADNALIDASFYILKGYAYDYSHTEGYISNAEGFATHAEGYNTVARCEYSHAEGISTEASANYSHAEGENTKTHLNAYGSHVEGHNTEATQAYSHAEGSSTNTHATGSHAEGSSTSTYGSHSHTEGISTMTQGGYSHAEGSYTIAYGDYSHAEGAGASNTATIRAKRTGDSNLFIYITVQPHNLHINDILEKNNIYARVINILDDTTFETDSNAASWALSRNAFGVVRITSRNIAYSSGSHAEGNFTTAIGEYSHAEGYKTVATNTYEHAQGMFNISHANTLFSIGNGDEVRSNAFEVMQNGNAYLYGVASFDGQTLSSNNTLQYFLNIKSIDEFEYADIFGADAPEIPFSAYLNRLHLYIDDWPDDKIEEIMEDIGASTLEEMYSIIYDANVNNTPDYSPTAYCNEYVYEDTVEIDGTSYYLWYDGDNDMYAIMDTSMTMERLENISKYHDSNADESPFVAIVTDDLQVRYDETTSRTVNKGYQLACYKIDEE